MVDKIIFFASKLWNKIPPSLRDWPKKAVLNFVQKKVPGFFRFCRDKISNLWAKVPNKKSKAIVNKITSKFLEMNEKIPSDVKEQLFRQVTGAQYDPDPTYDMQALSDCVQTDDEKKAAAIQISYLVAILGKISEKQEHMLGEYMNSLRMTKELKEDIINEMQQAEEQLAKFARELSKLDKEFEAASTETARIKKEANNIIDLI
jgi:hypothetical protein